MKWNFRAGKVGTKSEKKKRCCELRISQQHVQTAIESAGSFPRKQFADFHPSRRTFYATPGLDHGHANASLFCFPSAAAFPPVSLASECEPDRKKRPDVYSCFGSFLSPCGDDKERPLLQMPEKAVLRNCAASSRNKTAFGG